MDWRGRRRSSNIEDRRGQNTGRGGGRVRMGGGLGGMGIILLVIVFLTGGNPLSLLGDLMGGQQQADPRAQFPSGSQAGAQRSAAENEQADFVSVVLADTEETWARLFREAGGRYQPPTLVMFTDAVQSACRMNTAASGPFYCPGDNKVYIDLSFFSQLERMGARGDFARAYVIGHEVAHHVQNQQGISMRVQRAQRQVSKTESNLLRPIATQAFGRTTQSSDATCLRPAISRKACRLRPASATTPSSETPALAYGPRVLRTAHHSNVWIGSAAASVPAR